MEKHGYSMCQRFLAMLLCFAMLVPSVLTPAFATEVTEPAAAVNTTAPVQEWTLPECDCGSTETELGKHGETCARKVFLEEFCGETAADIFAKWDKLPEECQAYVLEFLGKDEADAEKLAELKGYVNAARAEYEDPTEETVDATEETVDPTEETSEESTKALTAIKGASISVADGISIPAYTGGVTSQVLKYDGGNGIANDDSKSYLVVVTGTSSNQFVAYKNTLATAGYKLVMEKQVASNYANDPNRFASYLSSDGSYKLYAYHLPYYGETRIIIDTQKDTVNGYAYEAGETVTTPKLVMWGLSTSPSGYHIDASNTSLTTGRENNGVLLIIRMKDNSLFFYDGGILAQMSDAESKELLDFCRELTGKKAGEKMVINTWFVSHAHDDHFQAFGRFINIHHNHFDLKNVVYNIDIERRDSDYLGGIAITPPSKNLREALDIITTHYPDVRYYKPHTGETFDVAGIQFDVIYTHEDRLLPDSSGKLSFAEDKLAANQKDIWDKGGTYRSEVYKNIGTKQTDFNDTSTVLRVNFENGVESILYADLNLAEDIVKKVYPTSELKTDIMMVPHHLFDSHTALVKAADAKVYLCAQSEAGKNNRSDLNANYSAMIQTLTNMGRAEGRDYDVFWGGSETVNIDINALGQILGYSDASGVAARAVVPGSYYTVEPANSFEYGGWGITTPASAEYQSVVSKTEDFLAMEDAAAVKVSNPQIVFTPHGTEYFVQEGRYLLMNVAYGHIMSFDATAAPEVNPGEQHGTSATGSVKKDTDGNSENTYYLDANGNVILDHSDRHFVLWNLRQYKEATGGTTLANGVNLMLSVNTIFGGSAQYAGVELQKRTNYHNSYWYCHYFDDNTVAGSDYQLRYFCFKSDTTAFKNHYRNSLQTTNTNVYGDQSGSRVKFIMDNLGDGTYLLYFKESDDDYRVVTCDANGKWDVVRYTNKNVSRVGTVADMKANLDRLKLRLYDYKEIDAHKSVAFSGYQKYYVSRGTNVTGILDDISTGITVFDPDHKNQHIPYNGSEVTVTNIGGTQYAVPTKAGYYWLDGSKVNTSVNGEYPVAIKYRNDDGSDTTIGEVKVIVGGNYASISNKSGTVAKNSSMTTVVNVISGEESHDATFSFNGTPVDITVGMLTDTNGNPVNTSNPGTYGPLTLTYKGVVICNDYTLTVAESNLTLDYPIYPEEGSVKVDKNGKELTKFKETGVAQIELSATAKPLDKGVDLIIIVDLSSSMRYAVDGSTEVCVPQYDTKGNPQAGFTQANWQKTRLYALEQSLKEMITTLKASKTNVRVAMSDFGDLDHYEFEDAVLDDSVRNWHFFDSNRDGKFTMNDNTYAMKDFSNHLNFVMDWENDGKHLCQPYSIHEYKYNTGNANYTGKVLPKIYTGSANLTADAFQNVNQLNMDSIITEMRKMNAKYLGTNYDIGLETAYRLAYARQQANITNGEDREIVVIFMSDGAAMQYNYLSGRTTSEAWSKCIIGETDEILTTHDQAYTLTVDRSSSAPNQSPILRHIVNRMVHLIKSPVGGTSTTHSDLLMLGSADGSVQNYPLYNGSSENFFEAMKGIGVECDWDLFFKLVYEHCRMAEKNNAYRNLMNYNGLVGDELMAALVTELRRPSSTGITYQTLSPYYYFYNAEGKNWWAEAIKGNTNKLYPVPNKFAFKDSTEWGNVDFYYGDVRNHFGSEETKELAWNGKDYMSGFRGLGLDLYTVGFAIAGENDIDYEEASKVLDNIASGPTYHYSAASGESLTDVLNSIAGSIAPAASRAYFTDTMGPEFDLSTEKYVNGKFVNQEPKIRVLEYTLDANGNRTGAYIVRETITFKGGKVAISDQVYTVDSNNNKSYPDIWDDTTNVITGKYVIYNANKTGTHNLVLDDTERTYPLPAETFFWIVGTIGETEMVLEYQVYLTGSMEGNRQAGVYDTNTSATLNYVNYLGNNCHKDTVTPAFPWPEAVVGYGFYLVDIDGNPLNANGDISSFADSLKIGNVEYIQMKLNGDQKTIIAADKLTGELDAAYDLFDPGTQYKIKIDSTLSGNYWVITTGTGTKATTYVANYGGAPTTQNSQGDPDVAYDRTVVWFALVVTPELNPDTVVIDFALPVTINVLANDGSAMKDVVGIAPNGTLPANGLAVLDSAFADNRPIAGRYGSLELLASNDVKYTLNSMEMRTEDVFRYAAQANGRYYYSTVTVIPATTIYYEDSFVSYTAWNVSDDERNTDAKNQWKNEGNAADKNQAQDRPGDDKKDALGNLDADNIYGFDGAYTDMATYSLGSAMKFTANKNVYGEAQFTFWGTGFDVVSLTSNLTGTITVDVYNADEFDTNGYNADCKTYMVDTYYGYKYVLCEVTYEWDITPANPTGHWARISVKEAAAGTNPQEPQYPESPEDGDKVSGVEYCWIVDRDAKDALYQVPVMKVKGLTYDRYTAVITVYYNEAFDHQQKGSYDFYLDAIRIYDPANDGKDNEVIEDAYVADHEGWPEYFELRNLIINKNDFNNLEAGVGKGIVFIDNTKDTDNKVIYSIADYTNYGPNNELYLAPGQSVAFYLKVDHKDLDKIHLAMKSVGKGAATVTYYNAAMNGGIPEAKAAKTLTVSTATDLYYDITALNGKTVVISNSENSAAILSITNVKVTYKAAHTDELEAGFFSVNAETAAVATATLQMLHYLEESQEPEVPEETVPETTVPEETEPEETKPVKPGKPGKPSKPEKPGKPQKPTQPQEPAEPEKPVFKPQKFHVRLSDDDVKVGADVFVTVTTGRDVSYLTINGTKVTRYSGTMLGNNRTWQVRVKAKEVGQMDIAVVCHNSQGIAGEAVVKTVTVTAQRITIVAVMKNLIADFFGRIR